MRAPDPTAKLYWFCGGDILRPHPETGAEPLPLEDAVRLLAFHRAETGSANRAARNFHDARAWRTAPRYPRLQRLAARGRRDLKGLAGPRRAAKLHPMKA